MLTVSFDQDVSKKQIEKFSKEMEKQDWNQVTDLPTSWSTTFNDHDSDEAISEAEDDVLTAAEKAKIENVDGGIQVGNHPVHAFSIED